WSLPCSCCLQPHGCWLRREVHNTLYVDKALKKQWIYLAIWAGFFLSLAYYVAVMALRMVCARKLLLRRVDPSLPGAQMELDFGHP
ncbi:hypothetical protein, partial [Paracidovorax citrulli]|uniref:hypothetical protein n=1 Tax=Paracidovorax citrulli TaxID=80869 RepID=UPI00366C22A2